MVIPPAPRRPPTVLLTGFDAFDGQAHNPSGQAALALNGRLIAGHRVVGAELPTRFGAAPAALFALMDQHRPALVVCTGLAGSRQALSLERVAVNLDDARIPDNAGRMPVDQPVVAGGPAAYFSSLPLKPLLAALQQSGLPAELSGSAGQYVCNHVFYALMHRLAQTHEARGGFVHVPPLAALASAPTEAAPLARLVDALALVIATALAVG